MQQYLDLMNKVMTEGKRQKNRTGIDTFMIPGAILQFDMTDGFPAVTTKKLAFNAVKGELLGFLRGYTSAAQFRELGCKIWDQNANENQAWLDNPHRTGTDDLGYIYSRLWTDMPVSLEEGDAINWNQINELIDNIKKDPTSRRLLVNAWHPEVFHKCALPPCHYGFQVIIEQETKLMHLLWNQRSVDVFLGLPFNIASYATLLSILARITGYTPGTLTGFLADVHIYENHLDACRTQMSRKPLPLPEIFLAVEEGQDIRTIQPEDIQLSEYESHPAIKAPMAV
jgi:thymidylate synthase